MERKKRTTELKPRLKQRLPDRMAGLRASLGLDHFPVLTVTILCKSSFLMHQLQ